jgi:lysophospholipase L1-like esterase
VERGAGRVTTRAGSGRADGGSRRGIRLSGSLVPPLIAILIFLAVGEMLARATNLVDRLNGYGRVLYEAGPSPELPYLLRPGVETTYVGVTVRIDRLGFRGPEVSAAPAPGVRRILLVGDSVVFGQGVQEEETVGARLAEDLAAATGTAVETVNAGVPGYDTLAEVRLLERVAPLLAPESVVVGMSLNDYDVPPAYSPIGILSRGDASGLPLVDRSEFLTLLRWLWGYARGTLGYQTLARLEDQIAHGGLQGGLDPALEAAHRRFYHDPPAAPWARLVASCRALAELARARTLRVLVVIFPEAYQVGVAEPDLTAQRRLLGVCAEVGLHCLDLQPAFAAAGGDLFREAQHPNAAGHAVAARAIAAALAAP